MSDFVEEFRDFNGPYQVSNLGRVRNKNTGRVLKTDISTNGYERFSQWNGKKYSVHRMVAIAFLPNYNKLRIHVNHIDGNKHNNVLTNLEWCTPSENKFHSIHVLGEKKGRPPVLRGSENNLAKLNEDIALLWQQKNKFHDGITG